MEIETGLTYDDVLIRPAESNIVPSQASTKTQLTRGIALNIPVISAAMDTVTEADMAIVMAQMGGIGVLHRNLTIEQQCAAVTRVKRFHPALLLCLPEVIRSSRWMRQRPAPWQRHPMCAIRHRQSPEHRPPCSPHP